MELVNLRHEQLRMDFERFRMIQPRSEARMYESIKIHGQLTPALAGRCSGGEQSWVLVDGFKRYRATQAQKISAMLVWSVECSMQALKVMVLNVGEQQSACKELEEALVIQSLHREDGLEQQEIAKLCKRHKSWVSRRIALIERLSAEVIEQMRLGLLPMSTAWELLRLQRRNQDEMLAVIRDYSLSSRQSRKLVECFLGMPQYQRESFLKNPQQAIKRLDSPRLDCGVFSAAAMQLEQQSERLATQLAVRGIGTLRHEHNVALRRTLDRVIERCTSCCTLLNEHAQGHE